MTPIIIVAKGANPFDAVKDCKLILEKPEYETNTLPLRWSSVRKRDCPNREWFLEAVDKDPEILAVWEDGPDRYIIAWVEKDGDPIKIEKNFQPSEI